MPQAALERTFVGSFEPCSNRGFVYSNTPAAPHAAWLDILAMNTPVAAAPLVHLEQTIDDNTDTAAYAVFFVGITASVPPIPPTGFPNLY